MKTFIVILALALTACGCGIDDQATVVSPEADSATQTATAATPAEPAAPAPGGTTFCAESISINCPSSPTPATRKE